MIQIVIRELHSAAGEKKSKYALDNMGKRRFGAVKDALNESLNPKSQLPYFLKSQISIRFWLKSQCTADTPPPQGGVYT